MECGASYDGLTINNDLHAWFQANHWTRERVRISSSAIYVPIVLQCRYAQLLFTVFYSSIVKNVRNIENK